MIHSIEFSGVYPNRQVQINGTPAKRITADKDSPTGSLGICS